MKPRKKKPVGKSSKSTSLKGPLVKKKGTPKKTTIALKGSKPAKAKVPSSENAGLKIQTENLHLSELLKEKERQLEIEVALEKVRAKTMAMHKSEQLAEVATVLFEQFYHLGRIPDRISIGIIKEKEQRIEWWVTSQHGSQLDHAFNSSIDEPTSMAKVFAAWKAGKSSIVIDLRGRELNDWIRFVREELKMEVDSSNIKGRRIHQGAFFSTGILLFSTNIPVGDEVMQLLGRFARVFNQTYTRFLDLQKAEAQAREAQIEAALERVRSRTMAMRRSEEIADILGKIFTELTLLDVVLNRVLIWIFNPEEKFISWWSANPEAEGNAESYRVDYNEHPVFLTYFEAWQKKKPLFLYTLGGDTKVSWEDHLFKNTGLSKLPKAVQDGMRSERLIFTTSAISDYGLMMAGCFEPFSDENNDIIQRFGRVFQQSYTRYVDVQKAEAQAMEAQIQLALERVRARTMAMHQSSELAEVASLLFGQLTQLGATLWICGFNICKKDSVMIEGWISPPDGKMMDAMYTPYTIDEFSQRAYEAWKNGDELYSDYMEGIELKNSHDQLLAHPSMQAALNYLTKNGIPYPTWVQRHAAIYKYGFVMIVTTKPFEETQIFTRFAKVFEQTYTRFIDLQKAEAQAREAQIETALERIRAKALAMQTSNDLIEVANVLRDQMGILEQPDLESSIVHLYNGDSESFDAWYVYRPPNDATGKIISGSASVSKDASEWAREVIACYKSEAEEYTITASGAKIKEWYKMLEVYAPATLDYDQAGQLLVPEILYYHFSKFSGGALLMISNQEPSTEARELQRRAATVFDLAYTRFIDLQKAEAQAKEAKIETALERVRSRSMAMHKSEELSDVISVVSEQLQHLGFRFNNASFVINSPSEDYDFWFSMPGIPQPHQIRVPYLNNPIADNAKEARSKGLKFFADIISHEDSRAWHQHVFNHNPMDFLTEDAKNFVLNGGFARSVAIMPNIMLVIGNYVSKPYSEDENNIIRRFATVFEQTYTRFLDLQKAEAQAREAQIEAALEKVRSSSLAMHHSDELEKVVVILFDKLVDLGLHFDGAMINIFDKEKRSLQFWVATKFMATPIKVNLPNADDIAKNPIVADLWRAVETGEDALNKSYSGKEKDDYFTFLGKYNEGKVPEEIKKFQLEADSWTVTFAAEKNSIVGFDSWSQQMTSDEDFQVLKKFSRVFEQAYVRFLDLQKAEAQAREAQVEAALERVRSRSMAMHKSTEVLEVAFTIYSALQNLGFPDNYGAATIIIMDKKTGDMEHWLAGFDQKKYPESFPVPFFNHPVHVGQLSAWTKGEKFASFEVTGDSMKDYCDVIFANTGYKSLPDEVKEKLRAQETVVFNMAYMRHGAIMWAPSALAEEYALILQRFAKVFEQTYTRFLDLQKAEAQAREGQIEAALEKVRSRSLAMHKSDELREVVRAVFDRLQDLNFEFEGGAVGIFIFDDRSKDHIQWVADSVHSYPTPFEVPFSNHPLVTDLFDARATGVDYISKIYPTEEKNEYFNYLFTHSNYKYLPDEIKRLMLGSTQYGISAAFAKKTAIVVPTTSGRLLTEAEKEILKRFARVFEQTYTRFQDLQKAEAQAREAQIEAGLERVRSSAMAMRTSDELSAIIGKVFTECTKLDMQLDRGYIIIFDPETLDARWWFASPEVADLPRSYSTKHHSHTPYQDHLKGWKEQVVKWTYALEGKEKEDWDKFIFYDTELALMPPEVKGGMMAFKKIYLNGSFNNFGCLMLSSAEPMTDDAFDIVLRFAKVFDLTYTRFNDLKQAEAQAREALIEAALEKIRSRSLAMHRSEEVKDVISVMVEKMKELDVLIFSIAIQLFDQKNMDSVFWVGNELHLEDSMIKLPYDEKMITENTYLKDSWNAAVSGVDIINKEYPLEIKNKYFDYVWTHNAITGPIKEFITQAKSHTVCLFLEKNSALFADCWNGQRFQEEQIKVLKRAAKVFEQAYIRFLDLQKAELQAREATIEASLERVRAKAMAMHSTADLTTTISTIFIELRSLGITPLRFGLGIIQRETRFASLYSARVSDDGGDLQLVGSVSLSDHPVLTIIYERWFNKEETYYPILKGDVLKSYYEKLRPDFQIPDWHADYEQYGQFYFFEEGALYSWSEKPVDPAEFPIFKRFTSVLALTYKRYYELQQSETNAREAVRRASLDRVRAEIASMRTVTDLERITPLIWKELTIIGIPFVRCGVFIMDEENQRIHTFLSTPDGKAITLHLPFNSPGRVNEILSHWKRNENYIEHWDESAFEELAVQFLAQGVIASREQYMETVPPEGIHLHCLPFPQGMFYVGNKSVFIDEDIHLIRMLADAFSTAYARYEDFNKLETAKLQVDKTLIDLKQTQQQLVQSEKMASLGELTAGIAHEIQNPLNFVNNFSEVSNELLAEMKEEIENGNIEEAKSIALNVAQNLEKILHHGKRADGIVKSMLQHSRSGSGQKELTDMNTLCDEYIRLSYHGLRAKDKSFNAKFETEFDPALPHVNIVVQEMGRVILNLINNAFYAVNERRNQDGEAYEPTVTIKTKQAEGKIIVSVKDNGNGIPQKVLDKIFQPFFTTKPTGEGTGLGLSLSYDIVKAHGGELTVETTEGKETTFIVNIPLG